MGPHEVVKCGFTQATPKKSSTAEKRPTTQSFPERAKQGTQLSELPSSPTNEGRNIIGHKERELTTQKPRGRFSRSRQMCVHA